MHRFVYLSFLLVFLLITPTNLYADQQIVINEFVAHPSVGNNEWVEVYVPDGSSLKGYWLDDDTNFTNDSGNSKKISLDTAVSGIDSNHKVIEISTSMFNNSGDDVVIFNAAGDIIDQYKYTSDPTENVSVGRTPDGTGQIQLLATATKGFQNSTPKPTDTPTPEPTSKPTKQPAPTTQPTTVKTKSMPTASPTIEVIHSSNAIKPLSAEKALLATTKKPASNGAYPTAVLGIETVITPRQLSPKPTGVMMIKGSNNTVAITAFCGSFILLSCAILVYFRAWIKKVVLKR